MSPNGVLIKRFFLTGAFTLILSTSCSRSPGVAAQVASLVEGGQVTAAVDDIICPGRADEFTSLTDLKVAATAQLRQAGLGPPYSVQLLKGSDTEFSWRVGGVNADPTRRTLLLRAFTVDGKICNRRSRLVFQSARLERRRLLGSI